MKTVVKNTLEKTGLLRHAYRFKNALSKKEDFLTLSPHLLIAVNHCIDEGKSLDILDNSDYLEFGLYRGFSFWYAQALARERKISDMRFFGFDSFSGLPPIEGRDKNGDFRKNQFSAGLEGVKNNLTKHEVDWSRTFLIPGYYNDSLKNIAPSHYGIRSCSICVVDCDLYESAKQVLDFVPPILNKKSFMIFDDWNCYDADKECGERQAFSEFMETYHYTATPVAQFGGNCQVFFLENPNL